MPDVECASSDFRGLCGKALGPTAREAEPLEQCVPRQSLCRYTQLCISSSFSPDAEP